MVDDPKGNPRRPAVYESAVDSWILVMLVFAPLAATIVGFYLLWEDRPGGASTMFVTAAITLLVTGAFTLPCRYTLLDDALSVRCGLIFYQIPLDEIVRVEPSASLRSGPALSLRRVLVATKKRRYLLSPKDRDQFIADLSKAAKHVLVASPTTTDRS